MIRSITDAREHHVSCLPAEELAEKEFKELALERNYEQSQIEKLSRIEKDCEAKKQTDRRNSNLSDCEKKLKEVEDNRQNSVKNWQISEWFLRKLECTKGGKTEAGDCTAQARNKTNTASVNEAEQTRRDRSFD